MKQTLMQIAPGMVTQSMEECKVCDGTGSFFQPKDKCKKCKGKKVNEEKKMLEIYIPRGSRYVTNTFACSHTEHGTNAKAGKVIKSFWKAKATSVPISSPVISSLPSPRPSILSSVVRVVI